MKIAIVGAGSTYTPELIEGLIGISADTAVDEIWLLDIPVSERKFRIVGSLSERMLKKTGQEALLHRTYDARAALQGADFIIFQFRAGLLQGRVQDEKIPLEFGLIGQETTGMGGLACSLRAFPIIEQYVNLIEQVAPRAWIINFSNPSGTLTEFMVNHLRHQRCIGLCNVPIEFVLETAKAFACEPDQVFLKYYGLNHLSWAEKVLIQGQDRTAEMWDRFKMNMKNIPQSDYEPQFLAQLKLLPNPYLRYYYMTDRMLAAEIQERDSQGTRGEVIQRIEEQLLQLYSREDLDEKPELLSQRGGFMYSTVATGLMRDMALDRNTIHIVNTRNNGAINHLPDDYILEIPARIRRNGPAPIPLGACHPATTGLIHTIKNVERLIIEGYAAQQDDLIKTAMLIHPLGPKESQLEALWQRLYQANRATMAAVE
ncbi:6-phospho-beta-glucosidase [bacterium]|nr:6-phospho-beta-glucosidase [bacterium]